MELERLIPEIKKFEKTKNFEKPEKLHFHFSFAEKLIKKCRNALKVLM